MDHECRPTKGTYEESVFRALQHAAGGAASLSWIYAQVKRLRERTGLPLNATFQATIRRTLQQSPLFCQKTPKSGCWGLSADGKELVAQQRRHS
jgi:hypothetical protein